MTGRHCQGHEKSWTPLTEAADTWLRVNSSFVYATVIFCTRGLYLYSAFLVLLTTQNSTVRVTFTLSHAFIQLLLFLSHSFTAGRAFRGNSGLSVSPKEWPEEGGNRTADLGVCGRPSVPPEPPCYEKKDCICIGKKRLKMYILCQGSSVRMDSHVCLCGWSVGSLWWRGVI